MGTISIIITMIIITMATMPSTITVIRVRRRFALRRSVLDLTLQSVLSYSKCAKILRWIKTHCAVEEDMENRVFAVIDHVAMHHCCHKFLLHFEVECLCCWPYSLSSLLALRELLLPLP